MTQQPSTRSLLQRRRGLSAPALLMALMMAVMFVVLVVDLAQLSIQKHQMQIGADAATLGSAPAAMDKRWLYLGPAGEDDDPAQKSQQLSNIQEFQASDVARRAAALAVQKKVGGKPIALEEQDIHLAWVSDPADRNAPLEQYGPHGAWNAVAVDFSRSRAGGNPPLLWMARQSGLDRIDVRVRSVAMVDTRLHGFRPLAHVRVPLVPLAVIPEYEDLAFGEEMGLPEHVWWAKGPIDNFTVHTHPQDVTSGGDGIAEMILRIRSDDEKREPENNAEKPKRRQAAVCKLMPGEQTYEHFDMMCEIGLGPLELAELGGQITLGDDPPAMIPADFTLEDGDMSMVYAVLLQLRGKPRVWPVAAPVSSALGEPAVGVIGFVAGCVVDCYTDAGGSLNVVIQPCLLQSPTALTDPASLRNPWIGKLLLVR